MNAIEVKNLTYFYPEERNAILKNISFKLKKGDIFGIIGPSGCGKTTLMLALSGLIPKSIKGDMHGKVLINNRNIQNLEMKDLSQIVQILFQSPESQLFALNVEDEITFGLENLNFSWNEIKKRLENTLNQLDIENIRHRSIEELSSGQKQKVALASLLAMQPKVLLFDEPTANLDPPTVEKFKEIINLLSKKHTIVIIEHNIDLIKETCKNILLLNEGRIIKKGKIKSVLQSKEYKKTMLSPTNPNLIIKKIKEMKSEGKGRAILNIKHLNFSYPNKTQALSNINLKIGKGDFLGIIGANGSGKSTLALNIIGLLKGKGNILYKGKNISKLDVFKRTKYIGYVFQNPNYQLFEDDLNQEIAFGPKNLNLSDAEIQKRVEEALTITNLFPFREKDPHELSIGQKRRISIASILSMKPEIIIVDEPDTGLDFKTARSIMDYVKKLNKQGMTVIIISHNLELISKYCNRIIALKDGKIVKLENIYKDFLKL